MKAINKIHACIIASLLTGIILISACSRSDDRPALQYRHSNNTGAAAPYPDASFAVISDVHLYDPSLGSSGSAFEKVMNSDRKLLLDGIDLLDYAITDIIESGIQFVLISGDLSKDGELTNHQLMADKLRRLTVAGIPAYVVPGNHDISNPDAASFSGDKATPVPSINADVFAWIYGNYGFNAALMQDDDSLSYVAELADGLWLLALDACRYRENRQKKKHTSIVSGRISQKTADWIAGVLEAAIENKKAVIAVMHHGIVEHWNGQAQLHPDYLIDDYTAFGEFLASYNVRLAFTGHYHALDITRGQFGDKFIYDIETGSLVTAPCPIRYVSIRDNIVDIRTETIVDKIHPGTDFAANAEAFVKRTVMLEAADVLKKYLVSAKNRDYIANAVGDAFTAHYNGDEDFSLRPSFDESKLGPWSGFVYGQQKYILDGLWVDLPPADNNVRLEL